MVQSLYVCRNILLGLSLALGLANLGLIAHWTKASLTTLGLVLNFETSGLIVGSLTAISLPILLVVGELRKNAYVTYVIIELPLLLVCWVLWLTTGVLNIQQTSFFYPFGCGADYLKIAEREFCVEYVTIGRLSIATSVLLMIYWIALLVVACVHHFRGNPVWTSSVKDIPLSPSNSQAIVQTPMNTPSILHSVGSRGTLVEYSPYSPTSIGHPPTTTPGLSTPTTTAFAPSAAYAHMASVFTRPEV